MKHKWTTKYEMVNMCGPEKKKSGAMIFCGRQHRDLGGRGTGDGVQEGMLLDRLASESPLVGSLNGVAPLIVEP